MADDEKESEVTSTRGADWEVVQLTESTYAAAPGPEGFDPDVERNQQESSDPMFMSHHFVFPPSEHENLQIEPELEVQVQSPVEEEVGGGSHKTEEISPSKSVEEQHGIQFFNDARSFSVPDIEFEEGKALEEESMYVATESIDPSSENLDSPKSTKPNEDEYDESGLPCEAWWKRHAACLYRHAKEANTFWSVFVAAALMGLVILGKQWHQEKWHLQHISDERVKRVLGPIGRFKDVLIGSHQRSSGSLIRDAASAGRR